MYHRFVFAYLVMLVFCAALSPFRGGTNSMIRSSVNRFGGAMALSSTPKTKAEAEISGNSVMVFSKSYCPYCVRAKEALSKLNVGFKVIELDHAPDGAEVQAALADMTGQRTVPNIFINGQHLGGCDATLAAIESGKLQKMLNLK